jgi:peptide/nickel transport system permease protein
VLTYILRRALLAVSVVLATLVASFLLFFVGPADPAQAMCPSQTCSEPKLDSIRANLGLDGPVAAQFSEYFSGLLVGRDYTFAGDTVHCDAPCLGMSFLTNRPVTEEVFSRFPETALLAIGAVVVFLTVGVTIGVIAATRRGSVLDKVLIGGSQVFGSIPYYVLALLFALYATRLTSTLPQTGSLEDGFWQYLPGLVAPWIILGLVYSTGYARYTRNSMIDTLSMDYVRTARSKGIAEQRVVWRHALRAALGPVVTILGMDMAALLTGTLITERIFEIDGIGRRALTALADDDLPVIMGIVLTTSVIVVTLNLVVDVVYTYIDPRVRLS